MTFFRLLHWPRIINERLNKQEAFNKQLLEVLSKIHTHCLDKDGKWNYQTLEAIENLRKL